MGESLGFERGAGDLPIKDRRPFMSHPQTLPIGQLVESRTNPRKVFDPAELAEMAESMRNPAVGVIQALIVRLAGKDGKHEIIAGAKRFRSAKIAGLTEVPVKVNEATDEVVLEMQLIENLQRSDPHPLEEAEGFARLLKISGYTADVIGAKIGKDRSYVYKRIQLTHLVEKLKTLFLEGKINIGHALQLCRLRPEDQELARKDGLFRYGGKEAAGVANLISWIEQNIYLQLKAAPWDKADAELIPAAGACTACPKRTGANLALFDDVGKDDRCLDRDCFRAKQNAFIAITIEGAAESGVELVKVAKGWQMRSKQLPKGVLSPEAWHEAVKSKCTNPQRAIIVAGEDCGRRLKVCTTRGCRHHGGYHAPTKTKADVWADKARNLRNKIDEAARDATVTAVMQKVKAIRQDELELVANRLIEDLDGEQLLAISYGIGLVTPPMPEQPKKGRMDATYALERHVRKFVEGHLIGLKMEILGKVIVGAVLADTYDDKKRAQMLARYRVDAKAVRATIAKRMQAEFAAEKKAALAAGKKAKAKK